MNKLIIILLAVMLISTTVFATYVFTSDCSTKTTASLLPTLVASKSQLNSYNFKTNEFTLVNNNKEYKGLNKVGCLVNN